MSTLGVIGCILGFLIVIYLCYKDWSVYLATFAGACVVIACNTLPFIDSLVGDYVSGMFTAVKGFFFMILFGCLQSKIYTESGAAYTIADTVMNRLLKENMSNTGKNLIGMSVILVIGTILNLGGIIAGVVIVLMYPIALVIFERCDIPKKFILGILGAGSFTFTLTVPGSPQVTNVAAMTVLGTAADVALVPGLVGAAAEIAAILVIMNLLINRARKRGEHFELHPLDPRYDSTGSKPKLIVALIPMAVLFLLFNIWKLNINICFMAAAGVTSKGNLSCIEPYEFMYKKAAINSSSTRILLVDSSKFGKMRPCMFSNLSDFDMVITDSDIGGNWISLFEQSNLKYIIV